VKNNSEEARKKRHARIRRRVSGVPERPRMCVSAATGTSPCRSSTTRPASPRERFSLSKEFKEQGLKGPGCRGQGRRALIARKAGEKSIEKVVFDRSGFIYTGASRPWRTPRAKRA